MKCNEDRKTLSQTLTQPPTIKPKTKSNKSKKFSNTRIREKPIKPTYIFEDGNQTRDFIHVKDIAKANLNALEHNNANYKAINIGTGKPITIIELAETLTKLYNKPNLKPYISNEYRKGDIRHCYADTTRARLLRLGQRQLSSSGTCKMAWLACCCWLKP